MEDETQLTGQVFPLAAAVVVAAAVLSAHVTRRAQPGPANLPLGPRSEPTTRHHLIMLDVTNGKCYA